jgi:hypothetical protein
MDKNQKGFMLTFPKLLELLDLKQKTASLAEARSTTKQGQAVMLFTIVTIIFVSHASSPTVTGLTSRLPSYRSPSSRRTLVRTYQK